MVLSSEKLNNLTREYQCNIHNLDRKNITEDIFNKQCEELNKKMRIERNFLIEEDKKSEERSKMAEEISKEEKPVEKTEKVKVVGKKPLKNSNATLIGKALMMKSVKKIEAVADKVIEWKPEADRKKIVTLTKVIINEVKKGKGRWKIYNWDEENFMLITKEVSE